MGTYLSTPVLEKHTETGSDLSDPTSPVQWAVVDMQGWRKSMEDAHVARTDVALPPDSGAKERGAGKATAPSEGGTTNPSEGAGGNDNCDGGIASSKNSAQSETSHAKVFAVFDGHGGPEVARFCQIYLVPVLTSQTAWRRMKIEASSTSHSTEGCGGGAGELGRLQEAPSGESNGSACGNDSNLAASLGEALIESFHALDRLIDDPQQRDEIDKWRMDRPPPYDHDAPGAPYVFDLGIASQENDTLDQSVDGKGSGEDDVPQTPLLMSTNPDDSMEDGERINAATPDDAKGVGEAQEEGDDVQQRRHTAMDVNEIAESANKLQELHLIGAGCGEEDDSDDGDVTDLVEEKSPAMEGLEIEKEGATSAEDTNTSASSTENTDESNTSEVSKTESFAPDDHTEKLHGISGDHAVNEVYEDISSQQDDSDLDSDLNEGVVNDDSDDEKDESSNASGSSDDDDEGLDDGCVVASPKGEQGTMVLSANDAYALFQKLLHMNGNEDEGEDGGENREDGDDNKKENQTDTTDGAKAEGTPQVVDAVTVERIEEGNPDVVIPTPEQLLNPPTGIVAPSVSIPTRIQNGRKVCNLPDHPVHAGCTSVVAVIVGRTLVVANAGDSRAVICRAGGLAEPLSFDHKPLQKREMNRITKAGGFVNQFGRVNGNLNLSRSIGDMKYKQVPGIPPADQMITAEPDIISTTLMPGDEFIILGCDGIWDCLSNEECVKYVRDRIDTKTPRDIGIEMLDEIVSADPRASQGIGGDNMTIMIVDLLPHGRPYSVL